MTTGDWVSAGGFGVVLTVLGLLYRAALKIKDAQIELLKERIPSAQELAAAAGIWKDAASAEREKHDQERREWESERQQIERDLAAVRETSAGLDQATNLLDEAWALLGRALETQTRNVRFFDRYLEYVRQWLERAALHPDPGLEAHEESMGESLKDMDAAKGILEQVVPLVRRLRVPPEAPGS